MLILKATIEFLSDIGFTICEIQYESWSELAACYEDGIDRFPYPDDHNGHLE